MATKSLSPTPATPVGGSSTPTFGGPGFSHRSSGRCARERRCTSLRRADDGVSRPRDLACGDVRRKFEAYSVRKFSQQSPRHSRPRRESISIPRSPTRHRQTGAHRRSGTIGHCPSGEFCSHRRVSAGSITGEVRRERARTGKSPHRESIGSTTTGISLSQASCLSEAHAKICASRSTVASQSRWDGGVGSGG